MPTEDAGGPLDPAAVVQCAGCGAVAARLVPPGWVVERPTSGGVRPYLIAACPACVDARYTFTPCAAGGPAGGRP